MSQPNPVRALSCNREAEHESGADWIVIGSRSVACRPPGQILGSASRVAEDSSKCSGAGACARPDLRSLSLHLVDMCRSGAGDLESVALLSPHIVVHLGVDVVLSHWAPDCSQVSGGAYRSMGGEPLRGTEILNLCALAC